MTGHELGAGERFDELRRARWRAGQNVVSIYLLWAVAVWAMGALWSAERGPVPDWYLPLFFLAVPAVPAWLSFRLLRRIVAGE